MLVISLSPGQGVFVGDPANDDTLLLTLNRVNGNRAVVGLSGGTERVLRAHHFLGGDVADHIIRHWRALNVDDKSISAWQRGDLHGVARPW